ncbi:MAG TPA: heavy metal-binding domain-containing protein [Burkholderiales bacterium]|nr:heavy metal-binding domain-containing protein [Burkholderiales bacterium]
MTGNYICPMHARVRETRPGKCPACGMNLVPEGTRFAMLQHMAKSPMMIAVMAVVMVAIMIAAMKLM